MLKKHFPLLLSSLLFGCISSEPPPSESIEEGEVQSEGIVSDDPPGIDDWEDDSGEDTSPPVSMTPSYDGCSNEIRVWQEPNPLTKPCNFMLLDQNGNYVELYDFEGDVVLLDFSTMWCTVCKTVAAHVQEIHDRYSPFSAITVLTEDTSGDQPGVDQLAAWANEYGITSAPVLGGNDGMLGMAPDKWNVSGLPTFFLIDKDFHVRILRPGWNEETIAEDIEALLAE